MIGKSGCFSRYMDRVMRGRPRTLLLVAMAISGVLAFACSSCSSSSPTTGGGRANDAGDVQVVCDHDPRVLTYAPEMKAKASTFEATLVKADPAPPGAGWNTWELRLADSNGAPIAN